MKAEKCLSPIALAKAIGDCFSAGKQAVVMELNGSTFDRNMIHVFTVRSVCAIKPKVASTRTPILTRASTR